MIGKRWRVLAAVWLATATPAMAQDALLEHATVFGNDYGTSEAAVRGADIVTSATMSTEPLIRGGWLQPGQHIDLIGAYAYEVDPVERRHAVQRQRGAGLTLE